MSVKVCYQDHKGQLVTKYFKSERALLDTLLNEARMIESIRRSKSRSENDLLLTREKYLLDLMDKYASPQTKKEWKYWEQQRKEEKRLKEYDAKYILPKRAAKRKSDEMPKVLKEALARRKSLPGYECCTLSEAMETPEQNMRSIY